MRKRALEVDFQKAGNHREGDSMCFWVGEKLALRGDIGDKGVGIERHGRSQENEKAKGCGEDRY